jgi:hypothetical protein
MTPSAIGSALLVVIGALLWWAGHLHYALRRGVWKSAIAGRVFDGFRTTRREFPSEKMLRCPSGRTVLGRARTDS